MQNNIHYNRLSEKLMYSVVVILTLSVFACDLDKVENMEPDAFECGDLFTDPRDGQTYKTIWIAEDGSHDTLKPGNCWLVQSLNFSTENFNSNCFDQVETNCDTFGRLYHSNAVTNICMNGWHVATDEEWSELFQTYGWSEQITGNGPIYSGNSAPFLPGGTSGLDFLMGGSCSTDSVCGEEGTSVSFWAGGSHFTFFNSLGNSSVWPTAVIIGGINYRFYVRCVQD